MELFNIPPDIENVLIHTDVLKGVKFSAKNRNVMELLFQADPF